MRAQVPLRRFIVDLAYIALYVGLFVWGFWVDVPRGQQIAGQVLALAVILLTTLAVASDHGHERRLRGSEPPDLSDPGQQWSLFFKLAALYLAFVVTQSLDLTSWAMLTISVPLTIFGYLGAATLVRAGKRRRQVTPEDEGSTR